MSKVTLTQLDKTYSPGKQDAFRAVKGIDLKIKDGEFMVLVGPSGCGKSTTLRMIAGLEDITGGSLEIGDRVVNNVIPKNRNIAMVFQNYALYPHMTVYNNMAFGLKLMKYSKEEIHKRVSNAAGILGLETMLDRKPKALSGGQRQRVALGRAIVRQPEVFLFDEPLSNLDAKMRVQTRAEITRLHAKLKSTMIYVTHDQVEAMTMGDRICVMKDGEIMQVDDPINLYNNPQNMFVAGFIGSPPMNFVHGTVSEKEGNMTFTENGSAPNALQFGVPASWVDRIKNSGRSDVVFGIRPECIQTTSEAPNSIPFDAKIDLAETMGAETYLYLETDGAQHTMIARVDTKHRYSINESTRLYLNMDEAHFFDPETESLIQ